MMATLPLIILLVLFVIGFPIGFALMLCVVPYFALAAGIPMDVIIQRFIASTESTSLLAIPFFYHSRFYHELLWYHRAPARCMRSAGRACARRTWSC